MLVQANEEGKSYEREGKAASRVQAADLAVGACWQARMAWSNGAGGPVVSHSHGGAPMKNHGLRVRADVPTKFG